MIRHILFSILAIALFCSIARAAEPAANSVESAGYKSIAAPGALLTAFGSGFPAATPISATATSFPLPTVLGGVSVKVDGVAAPLLFVGVAADGTFQINYQAPWDAIGTVPVDVFNGATLIASDPVVVSSSAPGIFTTQANGAGQAAAQNYSPTGTYTINSASAPVLQNGILILYCGGTGVPFDESAQRLGNPVTGSATPSTPLYTTASKPIITIGGRQAEVLFSGLAPGFVGLWQINVKVDRNTPAGDEVPVVINYGTRSTQSGVTVAVREQILPATR